jgi:hypothetical protein
MKQRGIALALVLAAVLPLAACSKGRAQQAEDEGERAAAEFVMKGAREAMPQLEAAIAGAKPSDGMFKCAHMANIDVIKKADSNFAARFEKLCTHDLQIAMIKRAVEAAEVARKAKPDEQMLSECFNADYTVALEDLEKAGKMDDAAKALVARFTAACPKS